MKRNVLRTIISLALIGIFLVLVYFVIGRPMVAYLGDSQKLQAYVDEKGAEAFLIFGLFIAIQTLSTCIPGLPFYLAAGYVLGGAVIAIIVYVFVVIFLKKRGKSGE